MFDPALSIQLTDSTTPSMVHGDAGQLEQVFLNVCLNARDALGPPGHADRVLRIEVDRARSEAPAHAPGWVRVSFTDNGAGMPEDVQARVFEPFFTTKEPGRGSGLGLATAYAIVEDHRGQLLCDSAVGVGTTFTVLLPAAT
jgi:signal transduction histidine kinase